MEQVEPTNEQKQPKYLPKTIEAIKLVSNGADFKTALQITNNKSDIAAVTVNKFKAKYKKYSLTHPKLVKSAHNQVQRILAAEARQLKQQKVTKDGQVVDYTEVIAPSDTNILAAASMVYDRYEPITRSDAGSVTNNTMIISPEVGSLIEMMRQGVPRAGIELGDQVVDIVNDGKQ